MRFWFRVTIVNDSKSELFKGLDEWERLLPVMGEGNGGRFRRGCFGMSQRG